VAKNGGCNTASTSTFSFTTGNPFPAGWAQLADVPPGIKNKGVKDGGILGYNEEDGTGYIYALKGNGRYEFYKYNYSTNTWTAKESIPAIGSTMKKKAVKKGSALVGDIGEDVGAPRSMPPRVVARSSGGSMIRMQLVRIPGLKSPRFRWVPRPAKKA